MEFFAEEKAFAEIVMDMRIHKTGNQESPISVIDVFRIHAFVQPISREDIYDQIAKSFHCSRIYITRQHIHYITIDYCQITGDSSHGRK